MRSINIFIIDDNIKFIETVINYLNSLMQVKSVGWASSYKDSLNKMCIYTPDLILIDFSMPDMNGIQVAQIIKNQENPPKVYILSLNKDIHYEMEAKSAGADGFISKMDFVNEIDNILKNFKE